MVKLILFALDIAVVLSLLVVFFFLEWSGLGYTLGFGSGFMFFFLYFRWKHGYWA